MWLRLNRLPALGESADVEDDCKISLIDPLAFVGSERPTPKQPRHRISPPPPVESVGSELEIKGIKVDTAARKDITGGFEVVSAFIHSNTESWRFAARSDSRSSWHS